MKKSLFISLMLGILISEPITAQTGADNPFGNALIPDMIADASIQEINGTFYCYATTDGYGIGNFGTACGMEIKGLCSLEL